MKNNYLITSLLLTLSLMVNLSAFAEGKDVSSDELTATFMPESGSQLSELTTFQIAFNQKMEIDWPEAVEVLRNGEKVSGITCQLSEDGLTATYTLTSPQTEQGTYTFHALAWSVCPENSDIATPTLRPVYYIGEPQQLEPLLKISPEDGATVKSLNDISIYIENVESLEINPEKSIILKSGDDSYKFSMEVLYTDDYMNVWLYPENKEAITKPGEYTLEIEEGAFILDGREYGYTFHYTIEAPFSIISSDPAEGETSVASLNNITLTFNQEIVGLTGYMIQNLTLRKLDEEGNSVQTVASYNVQIDEKEAKIAHLTAQSEVEIEETGTYILNIPPTLFKAKGESNQASILTFVITSLDGMETVVGDNLSSTRIYSIKGENLPCKDTRNLPRGIYIINGKKVSVK